MRRSVWYYKTKKDDRKVIDKLHQYAESQPTRGFDEYYGMIRNEGLKWNRKKVLRIYRNMKLGLRRKCKRRVPARVKQPLQKQQQPNKSYSMDFMSDALITGRKLRVLNVMDDCTRESLAAYAGFSIPAEKMVSVLNEIIDHRGVPEQIRVDNGRRQINKLNFYFLNGVSALIKNQAIQHSKFITRLRLIFILFQIFHILGSQIDICCLYIFFKML